MKDRINIEGVWYVKEDSKDVPWDLTESRTLTVDTPNCGYFFELTDVKGDEYFFKQPYLSITEFRTREQVVFWDGSQYLLDILSGKINLEQDKSDEGMIVFKHLDIVKFLIQGGVNLGWFKD